jgi:4-oxalocrotonate tautomerase
MSAAGLMESEKCHLQSSSKGQGSIYSRRERGGRMPIINVQILEGRPKEKVAEVIQNVTKTVSETLDAPVETIRVIVSEIPKTHWGKAGKPMSEQ